MAANVDGQPEEVRIEKTQPHRRGAVKEFVMEGFWEMCRHFGDGVKAHQEV